MKKFAEGFKIPRYYGDFGGDYSERDTVVPLNNAQAKEFEGYLTNDNFINKFEDIIKIVEPKAIEIKVITLPDGKRIFIAPSRAKSYALAGYLTIALERKKKKVVTGTYSKEMAKKFVYTANELGLHAKICLSKALCEDTELINSLRAQGAEVDDVTCTKMLDAPYSYINFDEGMGFDVIPVEANYGIFPRAAMTGLLASQYGQDLKGLMEGKNIDTVCVAIRTGTEAIGVMKAYEGENVKLVTVEKRISKEFHTEDAGCYTLVTRPDEYGAADISINPEIAHWWRMCKAYRLGADRVLPMDMSIYRDLDMSNAAKRAISLVQNAIGFQNILLVEEGQL